MLKIYFFKPRLYLLLCIIPCIAPDLYASRCGPGKQILWYYTEQNLDAKTHNGFSQQLFKELASPLSDFGYCLKLYDKNDTLATSLIYQENSVLRIECNDFKENHTKSDAEKKPELTAYLVPIKHFNISRADILPDRPLVSLSYSSEDIGSILIIFEKKIMENLRTQYICNLSITSEPPGIKVISLNGLSDVTPFEWVVPLGKLTIKSDQKHFLSFKKEIILTRPGVYNYFLQMQKRQIYHSKFFYPGVESGIVSGICYYLDNYFYNKYMSLDENDKIKNPDNFRRTFNTAKTFEGLSVSFLILSCSLLSLSILF
jgi:hypothetical protein